MLRLETFKEGFIYTIQISRPCPLRGTSDKHGFYLENKNLFKNLNLPNFPVKYHLYKNLLRLTWKNLGSYTRVFTVIIYAVSFRKKRKELMCIKQDQSNQLLL